MNNTQRIAEIEKRLTDALCPRQLTIVDDSEQHIGHPGARGGAGHFTVIIATDAFTDKTRIQCHQLIYQAVDDLIPQEVHALSIQIQKIPNT